MTTKMIGTGSYLPEHVVSNDDLVKLVDTSDEWIASRTGIRNRRIATKESGADMASFPRRPSEDHRVCDRRQRTQAHDLRRLRPLHERRR